MKINNKGQGLVSVLIAGTVGAIVVGFITDMLIQQGIGQKFLTQKLEINDLNSNVITTFIRANNCACQFSSNAAINPNSANYNADLKFDSSVTDGSQKISVKKLFSGCRNGADMPPVIAENGQKLNPSSSLTVDKVEFVNLVPTLGAPNEWQGQWQISFTQGTNSAVRSVKPITVNQKVTIDPSIPSAARIVGCSGTSTGGGTIDHLAKWSPVPGVLTDTNIIEDTTTGNIGIGTTNPARTLHLSFNNPNADGTNGRLVVENRANAIGGTAAIQFRSAHPDAPSGLQFSTNVADRMQFHSMGYSNSAAIGAGYYFSFDNAATTPVVITRATGSMGIGTVTPSSRLDVQSAEANHVLNIRNSNAAGWSAINFVNDSGRQMGMGLVGSAVPAGPPGNPEVNSAFIGPGIGTNSPLLLITQGLERVRIDQSGNVGIGTNAPTAKLHVNGGIRPGNATTGAACAPEGQLGYDIVAHATVYCSSVGTWAQFGGSALPGTLCGQGGSGVNIPCNGSIPWAGGGCPAGWTSTMAYGGVYTCIKN